MNSIETIISIIESGAQDGKEGPLCLRSRPNQGKIALSGVAPYVCDQVGNITQPVQSLNDNKDIE